MDTTDASTTEVQEMRAAIERVRKLADEAEDWVCSHGVSVYFADLILEALDGPTGSITSPRLLH